VAGVVFRSVSKVYDDETVAVSELDLEIADGEFLVLVGPSGCGKSTALRMVAGLEEITEGDIFIGERRVNDDSPAKRNIAMVFQNYALYPHMTVRKNIELALKIRKVSKPDRAEKVAQVAQILGLTEVLDRKPAKLSGGQRQRVAMGRAIVRDPSVFLLDEPLSNLDAKLRTQVRAEIAELQRRLGATTIFVTHDQVEAMTMADRVAVLRKGVLQQVGPPQEVYERPANLFVADFIGSPAMNLLRGAIVAAGDGVALAYGNSGHTLALPNGLPPQAHVGADVIVGIRPEHVSIAKDAGRGPRIPARITLSEPLGAETIVHVEVAAPAVVTDEVREVLQDVDETALEELEHAEQSRFAVRLPGGLTPLAGSQVELVLDAAKIYFFDPANGRALR
jgi:multiple sugar transport system ATP-binding protein